MSEEHGDNPRPAKPREPWHGGNNPSQDQIRKTSSSSPTFTVRPTHDLLPKLQQLARDIGRSEAQLMQESISDLIEMIEGGYDFVPPLVQRARLWREHATRLQRRQLGGGALSLSEQDEIRPSETVRNLSPELAFIPIYSAFEKWLPNNNERLRFLEYPGNAPKPCEIVGVPFLNAREATFGIKIDMTPGKAMLGVDQDHRTGDILLLALPDEFQRWQEPPEKMVQCNHEYLATSRVSFVGIHPSKGTFVGTVRPLKRHETYKTATVSVSPSIVNPEPIHFPLDECNAFAVVVQLLLVPRIEERGSR